MKVKDYLVQCYDKIEYYLPHKLAYSIRFKRHHGRFINWKHPEILDEKLCMLISSYGREQAPYADKCAVRDYVKSCGLGDILTECYGIWDRVDEIDLSKLPDKFVLKANHDCGSTVICRNKKEMDWDKQFAFLEKCLSRNYAKVNSEYHYGYIPHKIMAEELLDGGQDMIDYKILCMNGEPRYIMVCSNRAVSTKFDWYDINWKLYDFTPPKYASGKLMEKPKSLDKMLEASKILSAPLDFARCDFYDINGKVYFGEITLSPAGGILPYLNENGQHILGELLDVV